MVKTMFGPAKYAYLAKMVSLRSPSEAEVSVKELEHEFFIAATLAKKLRVMRATRLAANRARMATKRKNLSSGERAQYKEIDAIYTRLADWMKRVYRALSMKPRDKRIMAGR